MKNSLRFSLMVGLLAVMTSFGLAQQSKQHVLSGDELQSIVPAEYFFHGQKAATQLRNSGGLRLADGKTVLAALVDTAGYSSAIQQKYQGMLITEIPLLIEGSELRPGQYGFGFTAEGEFVVMDVASSDMLSVTSKTDVALARPVPLKVVEADGGYRLYAGRNWVALKVK